MEHTMRVWEQDQLQHMEDSETGGSVLGGIDQVVDGVGQAFGAGVDAISNAAQGVGDAAETLYHSAAAGANAFLGDMDSANQHNDAANTAAQQSVSHFQQAGEAITGSGGDTPDDGSYSDNLEDGGDDGSGGDPGYYGGGDPGADGGDGSGGGDPSAGSDPSYGTGAGSPFAGDDPTTYGGSDSDFKDDGDGA